MNELSERATGVAAKLCDAMLVSDPEANEAAHIIEQALLAERRLAMEEAAKMCDEEAAAVDHVARCASDSAAYLGMSERLKIAAFKYMGSVLRAAAEKEVGTK